MDEKNLPPELQGLLESLINETLTPNEQEYLQNLLQTRQDVRKFYLRYLDLHVQLKFSDRRQPEKPAVMPHPQLELPLPETRFPGLRPAIVRHALLAGALLLAAFGGFAVSLNPFASNSFLPRSEGPSTAPLSLAQEIVSGVEAQSVHAGNRNAQTLAVILEQDAGARFFQDLTPRVGSEMRLDHQYMLLEGHIELLFPRGARTIFDAPAAFQLKSPEQVLVTFGNCSVYAPEGSEGFEVLTPSTHLIDRGTRFRVTVDEIGSSEVHVVEGLVEAIEETDRGRGQVQMVEGEARHYSGSEAAFSSAMTYSAVGYRKNLPDRLISFQGPLNSRGEIGQLESATVIRGGEKYTYLFSDLIGGDVTSFCESGTSPTINFILPVDFQGDRKVLALHDDSFLTGVVNPGGAPVPATGKILTPKESDDSSTWTPGMTVRFRDRVVNSPGPDLLIFEAQTALHPLEGDAFHIRPVELLPGYHPITIRSYDLGMLSPESYPLQRFALLATRDCIPRLEELFEQSMAHSHVSVNYRVVATGIDLSDMGIPLGESVSEIFIQDPLDDEFRIDPVMVVGLPKVASENHSLTSVQSNREQKATNKE